MQKDFSYPLKIEDLSQKEMHYHLEADSSDLQTLQDILKVESVKSFSSDILLKFNHKNHRLDVKGEVKAVLELKSVISLENFEKEYLVPFEYYYDTSLSYQDLKDMELSIKDEGPEIIENGQIDLGQISIEQLALQMEDHPKMEGEKFEFCSEFDEETTTENNPFLVLKKLKK